MDGVEEIEEMEEEEEEEFSLIPGGDFLYKGRRYSPLTTIPNPNSRDIWERIPHLFYSCGEGKLKTIHPGILTPYWKNFSQLSIHIGSKQREQLHYVDDDTKDVIVRHPEYASGHLYGQKWTFQTKDALIRAPPQDQPDVERALSAIRPEYLQHIEKLEICYTPINKIPLNGSLCPSLCKVTLMGCGIKEFPYDLQNLNLSQLNLSYNPELTEIPGNYMRNNGLRLEVFDLRETGIKCLYLPANHNCDGIHIHDSPMLSLVKFEKKLYSRFDWDIEENEMESDLEVGVNAGVLRTISKKSSTPVIAAAKTIMGLLHRRCGNSMLSTLSPDVARMIARMVLQTKGRAVWFPLALQQPACPDIVINDIKVWCRRRRYYPEPEPTEDVISAKVRDWLIEDVLKMCETATKRQKTVC